MWKSSRSRLIQLLGNICIAVWNFSFIRCLCFSLSSHLLYSCAVLFELSPCWFLPTRMKSWRIGPELLAWDSHNWYMRSCFAVIELSWWLYPEMSLPWVSLCHHIWVQHGMACGTRSGLVAGLALGGLALCATCSLPLSVSVSLLGPQFFSLGTPFNNTIWTLWSNNANIESFQPRSLPRDY